MKKIIYLLVITSLSLSSCGVSSEDKKSVCNCEALAQTMKDREGDFELEGNVSSSEAQKKSEAEYQTENDKCVNLHKKLGEDNYSKAAEECHSK